MQALSIIGCPAESHLLTVLMKVNLLAKRRSHACMETRVSLVETKFTSIYVALGRKTMMMMKMWIIKRCGTYNYYSEFNNCFERFSSTLLCL